MYAKELLKDCKKCPDSRRGLGGYFCCWGKRPKKLILRLEENKRTCNLRYK